tara:strand:- start:35 stop:532 length:498 start_codon:yes stop_codon:yes gene_type:complete
VALNPDQSLGFMVADVSRLMRREFNRRSQELGLSQSQWRALAFLSRQQGINQTTLADRLEIQPMTLVRLVDQLQESGWVVRTPDPEDRRAFQLHLTDKAAPLLERMWKIAAETQDHALTGLSGDDTQALLASLGLIKRNLADADSCMNRAETTAKKVNANAKRKD